MLGKFTTCLAAAGALLVGVSGAALAGDYCKERVEYRHYHDYRYRGPLGPGLVLPAWHVRHHHYRRRHHHRAHHVHRRGYVRVIHRDCGCW
jgi:hypothetical protein